MACEIRGVSSSGTLYARLTNKLGQSWNGSAFETYASANYADYDIAMAEQGNSNVYVADMPAAITAAGTYDYYVHKQVGASPAEGDPIINTGKVDWTGTAAVSAAAGAMSAVDFYAYVLRLGFLRTDKSTEFYEALTDAVQIMRTKFGFDEAGAEATSTDTIATLGDFKVVQESDLGLLIGVVLEDGTTSKPLTQLAKKQFDALYPDINVSADYGYPEHFCLYAGQVYIGPAPDSVAYAYRMSYSKRGGTITAAITGVPFTNVYRHVLADLVQSRLYDALEEYDKASAYLNKFEIGFGDAIRRERKNAGETCFTMNPIDC